MCKEKNRRLAFVILGAVVCCICCCVCVCLVVFNNFKSGGVITIDTFIGAIATLIGVCVTIMLGVQIVNYLEFQDVKEKIKQFKKLEKSFLTISDKYTKLHISTAKHIGNTFQIFADKEKNQTHKIFFEIAAITSIIPLFDLTNDENNKIGAQDLLLIRLNLLKISIKDLTVKEAQTLKKLITNFNTIDIPKKMPKYNEIINIYSEIVLKFNSLQEAVS